MFLSPIRSPLPEPSPAMPQPALCPTASPSIPPWGIFSGTPTGTGSFPINLTVHQRPGFQHIHAHDHRCRAPKLQRLAERFQYDRRPRRHPLPRRNSQPPQISLPHRPDPRDRPGRPPRTARERRSYRQWHAIPHPHLPPIPATNRPQHRRPIVPRSGHLDHRLHHSRSTPATGVSDPVTGDPYVQVKVPVTTAGQFIRST